MTPAGFDWRGWTGGFMIAAVASYLPDLDHDRSTAGQAVGRSARHLRHLFGGHRMGTHSIFFVILIYLAASYILDEPVQARAAATGIAAHIWCDLLTVQGVGLLWPLSRTKIHIGFMRTGSRSEDIYIRLVQITGVIVSVFYLYQFALGGPA